MVVFASPRNEGGITTISERARSAHQVVVVAAAGAVVLVKGSHVAYSTKHATPESPFTKTPWHTPVPWLFTGILRPLPVSSLPSEDLTLSHTHVVVSGQIRLGEVIPPLFRGKYEQCRRTFP